MRLRVLSSGSKGNSTLIRADELRMLVDAGLTGTEMERRLATAGVPARGLDHIAVTHGHLDHARSAGLLSKRYHAFLHCSEAIQHNSSIRRAKLVRTLGGGVPVKLGEDDGRGRMELTAQILPHDAHPTFAMRIRADGRQAVILTDMGRPEKRVAETLLGSHVLVLEFNHDDEMLAQGPYPPPLKRRVAGDHGHLSNAQGAQMLEWMAGPELHTLVLAHLSETNNTPELALAAAHACLARIGRADVEVLVAPQHEVGPELEV
ncbi:MBL fold metallo-hydrolase [Engelhardtia mirabilis]|uniref:Metallo-hydrolase YycJ n=1 Tax=Engelhardtia mirabilis TaxID=2528011 RepID=A0A518BJF6_9BACT|nr:Putative metallo-hydrolase YycJ [Planctomycetes bacterium Pla133]QDV01419.1 Putative metallo-hydrolase YycJ [Planctomycetes bacterium Pla86]